MEKKLFTEFDYLDSIPCSTEIHLQILTPARPIRLKTRLIGVHSHKALIIETGQDKHWLNAKNYIHEGRSVIARIFNTDDPNAHVIAFRSTIVKIMSALHGWIIIDYPDTLEKVALRQFSRIQVNIGSMLHQSPNVVDKSTSLSSEGHLADISIQGAGFIGTDMGENCVGETFLLTVVSEGDNNTTTKITIKNRQLIDMTNQLAHYGLVLDAPQEDAEQFVQKVILRHLTQ